jgi:1-deoxy-D-xylulose-5-phosphate synthase
MDVLYEPARTTSRDVLLAGAGPMAVMCVQTAARLADQGIGVTVVDPRWVKPVDPALAAAAAEHRLVVTVEDNGLAGGFGDAVCRLLREAGVSTPAQTYGLPQEFLAHGKREEILEETGLVPQHLARRITEAVARLTPELADHPQA